MYIKLDDSFYSNVKLDIEKLLKSFFVDINKSKDLTTINRQYLINTFKNNSKNLFSFSIEKISSFFDNVFDGSNEIEYTIFPSVLYLCILDSPFFSIAYHHHSLETFDIFKNIFSKNLAIVGLEEIKFQDYEWTDVESKVDYFSTFSLLLNFNRDLKICDEKSTSVLKYNSIYLHHKDLALASTTINNVEKKMAFFFLDEVFLILFNFNSIDFDTNKICENFESNRQLFISNDFEYLVLGGLYIEKIKYSKTLNNINFSFGKSPKSYEMNCIFFDTIVYSVMSIEYWSFEAVSIVKEILGISSFECTPSGTEMPTLVQK